MIHCRHSLVAVTLAMGLLVPVAWSQKPPAPAPQPPSKPTQPVAPTTPLNSQPTQPGLQDDLVLLDSGLDSLCFAILVARLEDTLGVDPFSASDNVSFPVTLGDFVKAYENAAKATV